MITNVKKIIGLVFVAIFMAQASGVMADPGVEQKVLGYLSGSVSMEEIRALPIAEKELIAALQAAINADQKKVVEFVERAVLLMPTSVTAIVTVATVASPNNAAAIVTTAVTLVPKEAVAIVSAAVTAAPEAAPAIVNAAVIAAPAQKDAIVAANPAVAIKQPAPQSNQGEKSQEGVPTQEPNPSPIKP